MIYVSHAIAEVARLATTLVVLRDGHVQKAGAIGDVLADPASLALLGQADAGAVLTARITAHDVADQLTLVETSAGTVLLQGHHGQAGDMLRLRVPAQDIVLSLDAPKGLSALNALPVTITDVTPGEGPAVAVAMQAGDDKLLAQISTRSAREMGLAAGQTIYAIFKVTAITPGIGGRG